MSPMDAVRTAIADRAARVTDGATAPDRDGGGRAGATAQGPAGAGTAVAGRAAIAGLGVTVDTTQPSRWSESGGSITRVFHSARPPSSPRWCDESSVND